MEWANNALNRRSYHPILEIIFVYSQSRGELDIFASSDRNLVSQLQILFADIILNLKLGKSTKDELIYDLNVFKSRDFTFIFGPESGIADAVVKKLRLHIIGTPDYITLETTPDDDRHAIYNLLERVAIGILLYQMKVIQVGIKVTFTQAPSSKRIKSRNFTITIPNSCTLKHDGRDLLIRNMLSESSIEAQKDDTNDGDTE